MSENEVIDQGCCEGQSVHPSVTRKRVLSFREAYDLAYRQINADRLMRPGEEYPSGRLHVVLKVMADVYSKPGMVTVRVAGEDIPARDVQFVYHELGEAEVQELLDKLEELEAVRCADYMRTALYNAGIEAG